METAAHAPRGCPEGGMMFMFRPVMRYQEAGLVSSGQFQAEARRLGIL